MACLAGADQKKVLGSFEFEQGVGQVKWIWAWVPTVYGQDDTIRQPPSGAGIFRVIDKKTRQQLMGG